MQLFYIQNPESEIILSSEESKHATKVLRKKEGDILNFTDGKGDFYKAEITVTDSRKCRLKVVSTEQYDSDSEQESTSEEEYVPYDFGDSKGENVTMQQYVEHMLLSIPL